MGTCTVASLWRASAASGQVRWPRGASCERPAAGWWGACGRSRTGGWGHLALGAACSAPCPADVAAPARPRSISTLSYAFWIVYLCRNHTDADATREFYRQVRRPTACLGCRRNHG